MYVQCVMPYGNVSSATMVEAKIQAICSVSILSSGQVDDHVEVQRQTKAQENDSRLRLFYRVLQ
jgi:hypothetical protein